MKKLFLLFFLCCAPLLRSQEKIPITIERVEKEIDAFISKEKLTFKLSEEYIAKFRDNTISESNEHGEAFNEELFKKALEEIKLHELRRIFFERNPEKKIPYEFAITNREMLQTCTDGNFERGNLNALYIFSRAQNPLTGISSNRA